METVVSEQPATKTKIVIDRSKWRTGGNHIPRYPKESRTYSTGQGMTLLRNDDGFKCCLGFVCEQSLPESVEQLTNSAYPRTLSYRIGQAIPGMTEQVPSSLFVDRPSFVNTQLADDAALINDNPYTSPQEKEAKLLELFQDSMFELEFVGEYSHVHVHVYESKKGS